jgi:hypothetical protein
MRLKKIEFYLEETKNNVKTSRFLEKDDKLAPGKDKSFRLYMVPDKDAYDEIYKVKVVNTNKKKNKEHFVYVDKVMKKKEEMVLEFPVEELKSGYLTVTISDNTDRVLHEFNYKVGNSLLGLFIPLGVAGLIGITCLFLALSPEDSPIKLPTVPGIIDVEGNKGQGEFTTDLDALQEQLNNSTNYLNIRISSYVTINDSEGMFKIYNSNKDKDIQVVFYKYDKENKKILEDEVLYISPLLHTNENVGNGKLKEDLAPGKYNVIAMFNAYDLEGNFLGNFGQEIILDVQ